MPPRNMSVSLFLSTERLKVGLQKTDNAATKHVNKLFFRSVKLKVGSRKKENATKHFYKSFFSVQQNSTLVGLR